jgi:hypothetical protein
LISDGVTFGHDKVNLLGIVNALHPELGPVVVMKAWGLSESFDECSSLRCAPLSGRC